MIVIAFVPPQSICTVPPLGKVTTCEFGNGTVCPFKIKEVAGLPIVAEYVEALGIVTATAPLEQTTLSVPRSCTD